MTEKIFMNRLANGEVDVLQPVLDLLKELNVDYCAIDGLAANAYVEPVVSLDLDIIVTTTEMEKLLKAAEKTFKIKKFPHSLNLTSPKSDFRIQLQTDTMYQSFIKNAKTKKVMGYKMKVAVVEDVLQGKIWAYEDVTRRGSKRQKDLADILRLVEEYPRLKELLPQSIREKIV